MIDTNEIRFVMKDDDYELTDHLVYALCDEIDRLRGVQQTPPQGKTVEVKVPVVVTPEGKWHGYDYLNLDPGCVRYWLTATLPVPAEVTVVARVEGE